MATMRNSTLSLLNASLVLLSLLGGGIIPSFGGLVSVSAGYVDQWPPLPQPNDIDGTVHGCADAIMAHDIDGDGAIRRDEYLGFVNNVADLLCLPPRPILDLELQSVFVSIACLCQERLREAENGNGGGSLLNDNNDASCCLGDRAGLFNDGAGSIVGRTEDQQSYLRAACLWTQAVLGPEQCLLPTATLSPWAIPSFDMEDPFVRAPTSSPEQPDLLWLLLLLLLPLCCLVMCCCCCRRRNTKEGLSVEAYEITKVEEEIITIRGNEANDDEEEEYYSTVVDQMNSDERSAASAVGTLEDIEEGREGRWIGEGTADKGEEENFGRRAGITQEDDQAKDGRRTFHGEGQLPNPSVPEGVVLRTIKTEQNEAGGYPYPERDYNEYKYRRQDSGQTLDHYAPDGGVIIPQRPNKEPVVQNKPTYQRRPPVDNPFVDPRIHRKQVGLGDGEVWDALGNWEEDGEDKRGRGES